MSSKSAAPFPVARAYREEHIHLLKTHVTGKVAEPVFNLNELGSADLGDGKGKTVIATAGVHDELISST
jgi:hypothetical protein